MPNSTVPAAAGAMPDPIPALFAERRRVLKKIERCANDAAAEPLIERWSECDLQAIETPATTMTGAVASLEWARAEYVQFQIEVDESGPDFGDRLILALLDGALGVLRSIGGAA